MPRGQCGQVGRGSPGITACQGVSQAMGVTGFDHPVRERQSGGVAHLIFDDEMERRWLESISIRGCGR